MIDMLYKIEAKMSKVTTEVKGITNVKCTKCRDELDVVRNATWLDVDIDITIWEVISNIKFLPSSDSDQYNKRCN